MIFNLDNHSSYFRLNKSYNELIKTFITELMQTEAIGRPGYILSNLSNFNADRRHQYSNREDTRFNKFHIDKTKADGYEFYKGLGPLEFALATSLLDSFQRMDTIVLSGALGSGKTCLSTYVLDYIEKSKFPTNDILHFPQGGKIYRIDFNGISDHKTEETVSHFYKILIGKLSALFTKIHEDTLFIDDFIQAISDDPKSRFDEFNEFGIKIKSSQTHHTERARFEYLLDWLNKYDDDLGYKLRLISFLILFIKEKKGNNGKIDLIFLFDNIDQLRDQSQLEILNIIFTFSRKLTNIKILVPMRLTTFGKIKGSGSHNFSVLSNTGQPPIDVLHSRVAHFLKFKEEYASFNSLPRETSQFVVEKISYLFSCLEDKPELNRLSNFYSALAGNSSRRGLFLAERFFINSTIPYNETKLYQDEFCNALLVGENQQGKIFNGDDVVNNIFCGRANRATLLNIRILQITNQFKERNLVCTLSVILSQLSYFDDYSPDDILISLNQLIYAKRRLIYIEGVHEYTDNHNMVQSVNDVVEITYCGMEYLSTLVFNTQYLQSTFASLDWVIPNSVRNLNFLSKQLDRINSSNIIKEVKYLHYLLNNKKPTIKDFIAENYNVNHKAERMKMIRDCLYLLLINDLSQLAKYYADDIAGIENIDAFENKYIKRSLIIDIIAKTSINVMLILKNQIGNSSEIDHWYSFLLIVDLWQESFFKSRNNNLTNAIEFYKREFNS